MKSRWFTAMIAVLCFGVATSFADDAQQSLDALKNSLSGDFTGEAPRIAKDANGFVHFAGAPRDRAFLIDGVPSGAEPTFAATKFLDMYGPAFGAEPGGEIGYAPLGSQTRDGRTSVGLIQTYSGLPVLGGLVKMSLNPDNSVRYVLTDIMRGATGEKTNGLSVTPAMDADRAEQLAINSVAARYDVDASTLELVSSPELCIYAPEIVGEEGDPQLVWHMLVKAKDPSTASIYQRVLLNANTSRVVLSYSERPDAFEVEISDAYNTPSLGLVQRRTGEPPTGSTDVDLAYDFIKDTYDFYWQFHGRDGLDGAGGTIYATVNYCDSQVDCPMYNAFFNTGSKRMFFGQGFVVDDVTAHELTHGVTDAESNLAYYNESGAINESFSDLWGEFVDQWNGAGTDTEEVRWLIAEDSAMGPIRSMKDPTMFGDPDRKGSPYYHTDASDNGGVHINSGIGNKMVYLLTDGGRFNSHTITPMGMEKVADLFYEVQISVNDVPGTPSFIDYADLCNLLTQAALDLGYSDPERENIHRVCDAVEITPNVQGMAYNGLYLRDFRAMPATGTNDIRLTWDSVDFDISLVRRPDRFPSDVGDGTLVYAGPNQQYLDHFLADDVGSEFFYGVFIQYTSGQQDSMFARATVGAGTPNFYSEEFPTGVDFPFSQFLFSPVNVGPGAIDSTKPASYINYSNYAATLTDKVYELPVKAGNDAIYLTTAEDVVTMFPPAPMTALETPFPYFGQLCSSMYVGPDGFVVPIPDQGDPRLDENIDPTLYRPDLLPNPYVSNGWYIYIPGVDPQVMTTHFAVPRISGLFTDLSTVAQGTIWGKVLEDRVAITWENVPEYGAMQGNTFQIEMFYSGHIRLTYLDMNTRHGVVGLSDGRGLPMDPLPPYNNLMSDLSALPSPTPLAIWPPIPHQYATESVDGTGTPVQFTVRTTFPDPTNPPVMVADFLPAGSTYTDNGDGTATFIWLPQSADAGKHTILVGATIGSDFATQDVIIHVTNTRQLPTASNLTLIPEEPADNVALFAEYDYAHPEGEVEGASRIHWYRNNGYVFALVDHLIVPSEATHNGDEWFFTVQPITVSGIAGDTYRSDTVVIGPSTSTASSNSVTAVEVQLVINAALGVESKDFDCDWNADSEVNAADVQMVINAALGTF